VSLISDALKKAHVEAAHQDRTRYRDYMNNAGRVSAALPMSHGTVVLAAVLGGCVTAGAGVLYLMRTVRAPALPVRDGRVEARVEAIAPRPAVQRPAEGLPAPTVPTPAPAPVVVVRSSPKPVAEATAPAPAPRKTTRAAVATPPSAPKSRDHFVDGETYASPILGPLGVELKLNGISSTRGDAVAIINGMLMRVGATVGPFVIEEIESRRIRVRYVDVRFWVTY